MMIQLVPKIDEKKLDKESYLESINKIRVHRIQFL